MYYHILDRNYIKIIKKKKKINVADIYHIVLYIIFAIYLYQWIPYSNLSTDLLPSIHNIFSTNLEMPSDLKHKIYFGITNKLIINQMHFQKD